MLVLHALCERLGGKATLEQGVGRRRQGEALIDTQRWWWITVMMHWRQKAQSRTAATHLTRFPFSSVFSLGVALRRPLGEGDEEEEAAEGKP
jgi:hypothetical protein